MIGGGEGSTVSESNANNSTSLTHSGSNCLPAYAWVTVGDGRGRTLELRQLANFPFVCNLMGKGQGPALGIDNLLAGADILNTNNGLPEEKPHPALS